MDSTKGNADSILEENLKEESQELESAQAAETEQKSEMPALPKIDIEIELTESELQKQQYLTSINEQSNSEEAEIDSVSHEDQTEENIPALQEDKSFNSFNPSSKEDAPKESEKNPGKTKPVKQAAAFNLNGWNIMSILSTVLGCFFLFQGFDKMYHYYNGSYFSYDNVNAYVQGDAYNYIINGTYATAFFVLTGAFFLMAIGFQILRYLSKEKPQPIRRERKTD